MLRATARVHVACDGRSLGRMLDRGGGQAKTSSSERPRLAAGAEPAPPSAGARGLRRAAGAPESGDRRATPRDAAPTIAAAPTPARRRAGRRAATPAVSTTASAGYRRTATTRSASRGDRLPPAPWANVIANPHGGFVVTERGGGFTWAGNSYFYRLTPWHNDPVSDPASEALYLRDEDTGEVWSADARRRSASAGRTRSGTAPARPTFEHRARRHRHASCTLGIARRRGGQAVAARA